MTHLSWETLDAIAAAILWPLGVWIVLNGIDDLAVDIVAFFVKLRGRVQRARPARRELLNAPQKPIAILVPLWKEASVIGRMVQQNTASILYRNYHFFIGAYPNDEPTLREIYKLEARYPHVHLTVCPHNGPTSKADCLNWIFQNIIAYEGRHDMQFQILVTHDAEDVIHSDALHWINHYADTHQMVQIPVLPLRTRVSEWTHGVYIDDFTEYQTRDMPARQTMGAFVPSNGVGTGFRRDALDELARTDNNRVFEPVCLTEDYENGLRLRLHGAKQMFVPFHVEGMATHEFFPHTIRTAIRQRTRWVTGITLQTWERHGWKGSAVQKYWLWRDRKGLVGNPMSLLTNAVFLYCVVRWLCGIPAPDLVLLRIGGMFGLYRLVYRMLCVGHVYGWALALTAPFRVPVANYINSAASFLAVARYFSAKWNGTPLVWSKTEHAYPSQAAIATRHMRIGELLVANGYIEAEQLDEALRSKPDNLRLGEHLVAMGCLDEHSLYEGLSLQKSLPQGRVDPGEVKRGIARSLPIHVAKQYKLVPFRVDLGRLFIAGPELPTPQLREELAKFTALEVEFQLVTPSNYDELFRELLVPRAKGRPSRTLQSWN